MSNPTPPSYFDALPSLDEAARQLSGLNTYAWADVSEHVRELFRAEVRRIVDALNAGIKLEPADAHTLSVAQTVPPTRPAPNMTLMIPRTVTSQEVIDLIEGTGALSMPWWASADILIAPEPAEPRYIVSHWAADSQANDEHHIVTSVTFSQIVAAASAYLAVATDPSLDLSDSLGDADAIHADSILQTAVYGRIVFG